MSAESTIPNVTKAGIRELRLALVCYGGVSLAIYMHGITKEIHKLVKASTVLERFPEQGEHLLSGTEKVYFDLLARIAGGDVGRDARGTRIRVVVDVISGTSAGGINGVFLAKALAHNRTLDPLKELWFEKGDIRQLLQGWKRLPTFARVAWVLRPRGLNPPLRGDDMCRWLCQALGEMDERGPDLGGVESLMPDRHSLQLFVPITDYTGYQRDVPLYDPRFLRDRSHRHVMRFTYPGRPDQPSQLGPEGSDVLAFAARATSSFPGAFPPISFEDFERATGASGLAAKAAAFFPYHGPDGAGAARTYFIDGGVLDNAPFGSAIDALSGQPAAREVDRRLMYVEPDPTPKEVKESDGTPPLLRTVFQGYAGIPRKEPILDEVIDLWKRNEAVLRIRDVIEDRFPAIKDRVRELLEAVGAQDVVNQGASGERVVELCQLFERLAIAEAGFGTATYLRQRVRSMVDGYAAAICHLLGLERGSSEASFVAAALRQWAAQDRLLARGDIGEEAELERRRLLSALDLEYHRRRIRFLIAAASWLYGDVENAQVENAQVENGAVPDRADLDRVKQRLYGHLDALDGVVAELMADGSITTTLKGVFAPAALQTTSAEDEFGVKQFVDDHLDDLRTTRERVAALISQRLPALEAELWEDVRWFVELCKGDLRDEVVARYLGFPFWDVLVFPLQALTDVGERDHVEVYRMSPVDVELVKEELSGMRLGHFGAFFTAPGRQSDYLVGRLHAAERLIKLLLDVRPEPSTTGVPDPVADRSRVTRQELVPECIPAFEAILLEEAADLTKAQDRIGEVRNIIADLKREAAASADPAAGGG